MGYDERHVFPHHHDPDLSEYSWSCIDDLEYPSWIHLYGWVDDRQVAAPASDERRGEIRGQANVSLFREQWLPVYECHEESWLHCYLSNVDPRYSPFPVPDPEADLPM